jgi:hypothetical protein
VVYNELENPFWVYSNEAGVVWRTDQFNQKTITSKLGNFSSSNELVAVLKKSSAPYKTKLLTAKELGFTVGGLSTSGSKGSQACVVQRYIKSIGSKAFKVRTVWSKDAPPYCFIVTNKSNYYEYDGVQDIYKYMTYPAKYGVCTIFRTNKGKQLTDTLPFVENIVKFYRGVYGGAVRNVAGDFIKDESGIWWLVNIKALSVIEEIPKYKFKKVFLGEAEEERGAYTKEHSDGQKPRLRADGYQKIKLCKYCETPYHAEELTKKMTLKMIIELDKHLKYRGMTWDWLDRSEHQYLDISNLYEIHQVCKTW